MHTCKSTKLKASETTLILTFSIFGTFYLSEVKGFVCNIHMDIECRYRTQLLQKRILQAGLQVSKKKYCCAPRHYLIKVNKMNESREV